MTEMGVGLDVQCIASRTKRFFIGEVAGVYIPHYFLKKALEGSKAQQGCEEAAEAIST